MLLSIGMIVKNEEKYLGRCLSALMPILESIDSELIIADTGSTDNTVEIAKKFTDNVFYFKWINDFSAARNATLERARGEWFMYMDADEIFPSVDEIVRFFKSGEYLSYKSFSYIIRNYSNLTMQTYSDFRICRLLKLQPDMHFINKVHERFNTTYGPTKRSNMICDHFGYLFTDVKLRDDKFDRNIKLLLDRYESGERESVLFLQLAQAYFSSPEGVSDEGIKYLDEGIERCEEHKTTVLISLYAEKALHLFAKGKYEETLEMVDKYFDLPTELRPYAICTDAEMYAFKAFSSKFTGNNKEAVQAFIKYFDTFRKIQNHSISTDDIMLRPLAFATKGNYNRFMYEFIDCCLREEMYDLAADYLAKMKPGSFYNDPLNVPNILREEFIVMRNRHNYRRAAVLYRELDSVSRETFHSFVRNEIENAKDRDEIIAIFAKIYKNDKIFEELCNPKSNMYRGLRAARAEFYSPKNLIESSKVNYDALYTLFAEKKDISPILRNPGFDPEEAVDYCSKNYPLFLNVLNDYEAFFIYDEAALQKSITFFEKAMDYALSLGNSIDRLFELWSIAAVYLCGARDLSVNVLTGELYAAVMSNEIVSQRREGNYKQCIVIMKSVLAEYPAAKPYIMAIRDSIQREIEDPREREMKRLAAETKENIRKLISVGNLLEAKQLISEYEQLMPEDADGIAELKRLSDANIPFADYPAGGGANYIQ